MRTRVIKSIATTQEKWDELGRRGFNRSAIFDIGADFALSNEHLFKRKKGGF